MPSPWWPRSWSGTLAVGLSTDEIILGVPDGAEIVGGFPGDLFLLLVGLTYLFALAQNNGTIDLLVHWSMRLVRGRLAAVPWIFFFLSAVLSAIGALFAVAIVAPLAMPFARRYGVNMLLMGMMVVHGALGGAFSPISVYGAFVNETMATNGLPSSPATLFLTPLVINVVVAVGIYLLLGGRSLVGRRVAVVGTGGRGRTRPAGSRSRNRTPRRGPDDRCRPGPRRRRRHHPAGPDGVRAGRHPGRAGRARGRVRWRSTSTSGSCRSPSPSRYACSRRGARTPWARSAGRRSC